MTNEQNELGTMNNYLALGSLLDKYPFESFEPAGGEINAYITDLVDGKSAHIGVFPGLYGSYSWISVRVAYGEVRRMSDNRTHIAERGMAYAVSVFKLKHDPEDFAGSALRGNEIEGAKWRIGGVGPKGSIGAGIDEYVQVPDIVEHLISLERVLADTTYRAPCCDKWENYKIGW